VLHLKNSFETLKFGCVLVEGLTRALHLWQWLITATTYIQSVARVKKTCDGLHIGSDARGSPSAIRSQLVSAHPLE
jgi:hypothetical protein